LLPGLFAIDSRGHAFGRNDSAVVDKAHAVAHRHVGESISEIFNRTKPGGRLQSIERADFA
jgi:hypothetical protein